MENNNINENLKTPEKTKLNNNPFKLSLIQTNTILSNEKEFINKKNISQNHQKFNFFEKLFQIIKHKMQKNKYIFTQLRRFLFNSESYINNNIKYTILPFDLKKEIFLDKYKINKKKEEYYIQCQKGSNNTLRYKLFNKDINYISKTHINNDNILFFNSSMRYQKNMNSRKIKNKNESNNKCLNNDDLNKKFYLERKIPIIYYKNRININDDSKNNNNSNIYTKRAYFKNQNKINKKQDKNIKFSFSGHNNIFSVKDGSFHPYSCTNIRNKHIMKIIRNNHRNIDNIFLSDNLEDEKIQTYNPKKNYNLYYNYIMNNTNNIKSDRALYKKNYSSTLINKNISSTNEIKDSKFKEFVIHYNNKEELSFDNLRKNLQKEFSKNYQRIINNNYCEFNDKIKGKINNKYNTYNNLINIKEKQIINRDINFLKNYENNTSKIETYIISFNSTKSQINNFYKEDMIYHRPKSSSKFQNKNKILIL